MLVGLETSDDAAVYRISEDKAIIHTIDFFTPVVDDPFVYGQIAAANALSDVYAMGGRVLMALNIVCFPADLDLEILKEILEGGADKVKEAGGIIGGGHTIEDKEPKYGLSVMGVIHPKDIIRNSNARPGDILVLTKPLGIGIILTAIKGDLLDPEDEKEAVRVMSTLNKIPGELMLEIGVNSCTDITGFGLLGHGYEMAVASNVTMIFNFTKIPFLKPAEDLAKMGIIPGGAYKNRNYLKGCVKFDKCVPEFMRDILFDPQTSGGLLISLSPEKGKDLIEKLHSRGVKDARVIGRVEKKGEFPIVIEE